jgi:glycosyltransferase involved in cell wall biosynthesis
MPREVFLIVTARNEADRIGTTLAALARAFPGAPVWLADDGSTDATPEIARDAGARVVRSERHVGKGAAATLVVRDALRFADGSIGEAASLGKGPRGRGSAGQEKVGGGLGENVGGAASKTEPVFVLCDGDLGESARALAPLAQAVRSGEADIAVGVFARRLGGGVGLAVAFARWAIRRRCGLRTRAPISGQRALRARVLADVLPFAHGFGMEVGMTIDAVRAGYRIAEIELDLAHRATGRTPPGFAHRARQLVDFVRAFRERS